MWNKALVKISLIAAAAVCVGLAVNYFRGHPLGLRYTPKQERFEAAVAQVGGAASRQFEAKPTAFDEEHLKAFSALISKKSESVYNRALEVWAWSDSMELQRSVITVAAKKVTTTDEAGMLELMSKALDDPAAQWRECERLSRGNSLEKLIASRRIAILEINPRVKAAKEAGVVQTSFPAADHPQEIQWQSFRALAEAQKAIIIDARPEKLYKLGHVPGALNISREQFAADYEKARTKLEADKECPVAVYCNGLDCEDSKMVSGALIKFGFRRVLIFKRGWQEWTFQHLPEEK